MFKMNVKWTHKKNPCQNDEWGFSTKIEIIVSKYEMWESELQF